MKKVGIITRDDDTNYGNRLQNYAVQVSLNKLGYSAETIRNFKKYKKIKRIIKKFLWQPKFRRNSNFEFFNKKINISKFCKEDSNLKDKFDYFVTGSDQVWNPTIGSMTPTELLNFADDNQKIAFAASFGIHVLPEEYKNIAMSELHTFKAISVRECDGKKIVEDLTGREDAEVILDPTMLLTNNEWDRVSKKPKMLKNIKYILCYFLGNVSDERKMIIENIASENNCNVIYLLDENSPFYVCGPSEFLYLEKNAFLICTDSFHSCVFAIIYDTPFIVFERQDKLVSMNSRIDTLLSKFNLQNRRFNGQITEDLLQCDYKEAKEILEKEKEKSIDFLKRALDIEDGD